MAEIGQQYEELLAPVFNHSAGKGPAHHEVDRPVPANAIAMYSSVGQDPMDLIVVNSSTNMPVYWRANLEHSVQFSGAVSNIVKIEGKDVHLVEIGPHAALRGPIKQIRTSLKLGESSLPYSPSLVRDQEDDICLKNLAGTLFTNGCSTISWAAVSLLPESGLKFLPDLAPYPWDFSGPLLWSEPRASVEMRNRNYVRHELLGTLALTGNGIDHTWRNLLKLSEVPWLMDHKVEETIVFPTTAYLAMAVEAVSQITGCKDPLDTDFAFEFCDVNISAALNVPSEERDVYSTDKDLELHTTMSARKISNANKSADWYDWAVSSWLVERTTVHCAGSIRIVRASRGEYGLAGSGVKLEDTEAFDVWPNMSKWYKKWNQEGLCFGPHFQSLLGLHTDSRQVRRETIGITQIEPLVAKTSTTYYPVHPVTIDAALQAAILSSTAGRVSTLKTWLPVFVSHMRLQAAARRDVIAGMDGEAVDPHQIGEIQAWSEETGLSTRQINGTLRDVHNETIIDFRGVRTALYTGRAVAPIIQQPNSLHDHSKQLAPVDVFAQRQPTLRVHWKPDVLRLRAGAEAQAKLREYVDSFVDLQHDDLRDDESMATIAALLDLTGHKTPRLRVLEIGGDAEQYKAKQWLSLLGKGTAFARVRSWQSGALTNAGGIALPEEVNETAFDVIVVPKYAASKHICDEVPQRLSELLSETGIIIVRKADATVSALTAAGFEILDVGINVLLAVRPVLMTRLTGRNVLIVHRAEPSAIVNRFVTVLVQDLQQKAGVSSVRTIAFDRLDASQTTDAPVYISLLEMESELLATISSDDMSRLRIMTDNATDLLWITAADMQGTAPNPNLTLTNGLSRALMLEQPMLRFAVLDAGPLAQLDASVTSDHAIKALVTAYEKDDAEFIAKNGLLHVSRYEPDHDVNSLFRRRMELNGEKTTLLTLIETGTARLAIGQIGAMDTLHFQQLSEPVLERAEDGVGVPGLGAPPTGYVDVQVRAVGLNAKDVYAMSGRVDTQEQTTAIDFSGVVTAIGPGVTHLEVGQRVAACAPHHMGTAVRVRAGAVQKMLDTESTVVPALLFVYATALYALNERAHLRRGESILVHAGSGGLGIATIKLAQRLGAVIYTTAGSSTKRDFLINELGVPAHHVFNSRDQSFVADVMLATGGRGVDVVLNSLVGDLMHESWRCLAMFGRFVEVGKRELIDAGKLDMRVFLRQATFTAFDLSELFFAQDAFHVNVWDRLVGETLKLYRANAIGPLPAKVFDVSQVAQAYRYFANKDRVGKVIISMELDQSVVPVAPATYLSVFDAGKVYLLIGCLGGLGRSLSRWMMKRGARKFVFMGRSGADKPSARQLVERLENAGASVKVIRGDVSNARDVSSAVAACVSNGRRIGGVVQAAMGLSEALFTRMSHEAWRTGIDLKYQGTWNLHNALQVLVDQDPASEPDFFLLTSSVSGTVGTATESNYCSANGFLDAFARWRRSRGQACVAVGLGMISEVGYLHENPEIEALLLRKGIQPLNEEEFLQIVDLALGHEAARKLDEAHLLTGLEPAAVRELTAKGFDVTTHGVMVEARASLLLASLLAEQEAAAAPAAGSNTVKVVSAPWMKDISAKIAPALLSEANAASLHEAILQVIKKRFSSLILLPPDQITESRSLPDFGVDSMISSEFRSWFWSVFKVDIPFMELISAQTSLEALAQMVEAKLKILS